MSVHAFETIRSLQSRIKNKTISRAEVIDYYHHRCQALDTKVDALLEVFSKESLVKDAKDGVLSGIPGVLKDNICQKDRITSCASRILEHFSSPYDATTVERLHADGGVIMGRANQDEFAMGSSTETSAYKKTKNPWDVTRVPGGSGGGSAVAVAAGLVPWALGSDTGGSVRQPAALCGVVGFKPTYGLVSRYGLVAYGSSIDQIGINAHTAYDTAMILSAIAGHDPKDSTTLTVEKKDYTQGIENPLPAGLRIGIVEDALYAQGMDPEIVSAIEDAIKTFEQLGATFSKTKCTTLQYGAASYFVISRAEAASNLARFDGVRYGYRSQKAENLAAMYAHTRHDGFGSEVKSRIMIGNYVLSSGHSGEFYDNAKKAVDLMRAEFTALFKQFDVLLMPTHPISAFPFGAFDLDPLQIDLQDYFTCPINLVGIPAISLPCGFTRQKLPIGFQLVGPHLSESFLLQLSHAFQQKTDWHNQHPSGF